MKVRKWYFLCVTLALTSGSVWGNEVSDEIARYVTPPAISDEVLRGIESQDEIELAYKIHGNNFKCKSFEEDLSIDKQEAALKYGYLSSFSYSGRSKDVREAMDSAKNEASQYELLSDSEIERILESTSLKVDDGSIFSAKDEKYHATTIKELEENNKKRAEGKRAKDQADIMRHGRAKFDAKIFVKRNNGKIEEIVIAYRGTQLFNGRDWVDNVKQLLNEVPEQYEQAAELLSAVLANEEYANVPVVCTGHSLGGGLATYAMAKVDLQGRVKGYTYDAAGLSMNTLNSLDADKIKDASKNMINVRAKNDPVSYVGYHLGPMYEIGVGTDAILKNHSLEALIDAMNNSKDPFASEPEHESRTDTTYSTPCGSTSGGRRRPQPATRHRGGSGGGDTKAKLL